MAFITAVVEDRHDIVGETDPCAGASVEMSVGGRMVDVGWGVSVGTGVCVDWMGVSVGVAGSSGV